MRGKHHRNRNDASGQKRKRGELVNNGAWKRHGERRKSADVKTKCDLKRRHA